jgi:hypothetical protein
MSNSPESQIKIREVVERFSPAELKKTWGSIYSALENNQQSRPFVQNYKRLGVQIESLAEETGLVARRGVSFIERKLGDASKYGSKYLERGVGGDYDPNTRQITHYSSFDRTADLRKTLESLAYFGSVVPTVSKSGEAWRPRMLSAAHELIHDSQFHKPLTAGKTQRTTKHYRPVIEIQAYSGMNSFFQQENYESRLLASACDVEVSEVDGSKEKFESLLSILHSMAQLRAIGWTEEQIADLVKLTTEAKSYTEAAETFQRGFKQSYIQEQLRRSMNKLKVNNLDELKQQYYNNLRIQEETVKSVTKNVLEV